jgi:hypothetical protein
MVVGQRMSFLLWMICSPSPVFVKVGMTKRSQVNVFHHRAAHPTQTRAARLITSIMAQYSQSLQLSKEGRLSLAIASFQNNPYEQKRALALAFDVPESTLRTRLRGVLPRHETTPVNVKMSPVEEQSLV